MNQARTGLVDKLDKETILAWMSPLWLASCVLSSVQWEAI